MFASTFIWREGREDCCISTGDRDVKEAVHSKNLRATDSLMIVAVLQRWMNKNLSQTLSFGRDSRLRSVIVIVRTLRRLCCHPDVTVMQATYNWNGNKPARLCDGVRLIGAKGRLAVQTIMRPGDVIILFDVFPQQSFQVFFSENHDVIQQLPPQGAAIPFDEWILPGTAKGSSNFFDDRSL